MSSIEATIARKHGISFPDAHLVVTDAMQILNIQRCRTQDEKEQLLDGATKIFDRLHPRVVRAMQARAHRERKDPSFGDVLGFEVETNDDSGRSNCSSTSNGMKNLRFGWLHE